MLLRVITIGNDKLKQKSEEIDKIDDDIKTLVKDMYDTMYYSGGIGLAAIQVGVLKRLFVIDIPDMFGGKHVFINPVIKDLSKERSVYDEGCLSIPGINSEVERAAKVTVEYTDLKGKRKTLKASGLLATCIQHEYDHLEGILFVDRLEPETRLAKIREFKRIVSKVENIV